MESEIRVVAILPLDLLQHDLGHHQLDHGELQALLHFPLLLLPEILFLLAVPI